MEEASDRLTKPAASGELKEEYVAICRDLLTTLTPLEPYWAYPGMPQFSRVSRLFSAGSYDKFAHAVSQINWALTTESYRSGDVEHAGLDEHDIFGADPRQLEHQPATKRDQPYFEVLVVESVTEEQERALRNEVRSWRRPDDEFVYELVVVSSGDEALIAARLNVNLQAVVIRRRFSHQSTRDLSSLAEFVDSKISDELADHRSPDERAEILATSLSQLRPELDLYLMTEIEVEDIAGRLGQHFRRVFHAREGVLELHLSILQGVAARYRTPFFSRTQAVQPPTDRRLPRPTDLTGQVDRQLALDQGHGRLLRPRRVHGGDVGHLRWTRLAARAHRPAARCAAAGGRSIRRRGTHSSSPTGLRRPTRSSTQSLVAPGDIVLLDRNCHQSHHYGMMLAGAQVIYLEAYPLPAYSMYGAVPLREIKSKLLALKRAGKLDRVKMISLTNCTFDGIVYDVSRVMEECLAIKPDLVFLWDEAWFAFARFHPVYRNRTAMAAARNLRDKLCDENYTRQFEATLEADAKRPLTDDELMNAPADAGSGQGQGARLRHPVDPQDADVAAAGLDDPRLRPGLRRRRSPSRSTRPTWPTRRRRRTTRSWRRWTSGAGRSPWKASSSSSARSRTRCNCGTRSTTIPLLSKYMACLRTSDLIPDEFRPSHIAQPLRSGLRNMMAVWDTDEFVLDPSRITLSIGRTGFDGDTFKREQLMDRHGVQINKTSRNTVLFMTNIGTTRSSVAFLVEVLVKIAGELDERISEMGLGERSRFEQRVRRLTASSTSQPDFSGFHRSSATTPAPSPPPKATCVAPSTCPTTTPTAST